MFFPNLLGNLFNGNDDCQCYVAQALEEFTDQQLDDMLNCNIQSLVSMTRAVLPSMKQRRSGCVISISSGSGNWCSPYLVVYSATK